MVSDDEAGESVVSEISSAVLDIQEGDELAESGEEQRAAERYLEAMSQLKTARERTEGEVGKVADDLLKCANQHGRLLIDGEPVSNGQDITEIIGDVGARESDSSYERGMDARNGLERSHQAVQERIQAGNRLRSEGRYGKAIEAYREAKEVINQELTRYSGASLESEVDLYIREAKPKKRRAVRRLPKLDDTIRHLDRELLARHGLELTYRRAAVDPETVSEPVSRVYSPPLNPKLIGAATDYYRELGSFERHLASTVAETGGPTAVTRQLGGILDGTHATALTNLAANQGVVRSAATILDAYETLVVESDDDGVSELATRLDAIHSDVVAGTGEDAVALGARLDEIQEWVDERSRRAETVGEAIEELNVALQQLDRELLARHGFELTCRCAAIDVETVDEPAEVVCKPPFDPAVIAATTGYYRELESFERHLASTVAETSGLTTVTERVSTILDANHTAMPTHPKSNQAVVSAACDVLAAYESLVEKGVDDGVAELEARLDAIHVDVVAGKYEADAEGLADNLTELKTWIGRQTHRADLESWRDDIREVWPATAEQQLQLDITVVDQLTGFDSGTPSLSEFQSGLETAEQVVALAETVETAREQHQSPVMDQVPEAFGRYLDARDITSARLEQLKATLPVIERACDAQQQYPTYPFDSVGESLCKELETGTFDVEIPVVVELLESATKVLVFLDDVDTTHPSIEADEWRETVETGLKTGTPERIHPLVSRAEQMSEGLWEHQHLYQFDWQEFEQLVATVFQSQGYDTRVTQPTNDEGVDVWAQGDNDRIAIQVKQTDTSNEIGRPPLQKLASTISKGDANRVIIVTSSEYRQTAREYADEFGPTMELINGTDLIRMLTDSNIPPPLSE